MSAPRILFVTNRVPYPLRDGGALAMDAMIRGYHAQGADLYVLSMNTSRHPVAADKLKTLYPFAKGFEALPFDNRLKPLSLLRNLLLSREPEHAERFYSAAFGERLLQVIDTFQPDIIQVESLFLSGYLPAIRRSSKAFLVLRMHNVEYEIWDRLANESRGLKAAYLRLLAGRMRRFEEQAWGKYDLLLPITDADAAAVRRLDPTLVLQVAPFGIDVAPELAVPSGSFRDTYHVGAMDWLPNCAAMDWLLHDIWPLVRRAVPDATFHFAGRHMPQRFFRDLPPGVFCDGEVPDINAFYADKQVLLVPLRSGGGIRVKILEAMAAGKLVISTDTGMQGITAEAGTHYVRANTPEAFAAALKWCREDAASAQAMVIAAGRLAREQYNLDTITSNVFRHFPGAGF